MAHSKWAKGTGPLTEERLVELIESYGADPEHWPAHERGPAEARLAQSDHARQVLAEAAILDDMLNDLVPPVPSSRLAADLARAMPGKKQSQTSWVSRIAEIVTGAFGSMLAPRPALMMASMAAIFAIGVSVGWVAALQPQTGPEENFVFSLVGGGDDDVMVSGVELAPQIFDGDLIVALH